MAAHKTEGQECPQTDKSHSDNAGGILEGANKFLI